MNFFKKLFGRNSKPQFSKNDIETVANSVQQMVNIINESLKIANESNEPSTKMSRLGVAKDKLVEVKELSSAYPFISLTSLNDVENSIRELEAEFTTANYKEIADGNMAGERLEKEGKVAEAILKYEQLVQDKVDTPYTYRRLAILYRKQKNVNKEEMVLSEDLKNIPESNSAHYSWFKDRLDKMNAKKSI